jgi:hypothetical protein
MNPKRGRLIIGAYPHGAGICHRYALGCLFDDGSRRKISGSADGCWASVKHSGLFDI